MSGNRPNLAGAFAPIAPRGAKLEGMLAPKRRRVDEVTTEAETLRPVEPAPLAVVPEPPNEVEPFDISALSTRSGPDDSGEEVAKAPKKEAARTGPSSPTKPRQTAKKPAN